MSFCAQSQNLIIHWKIYFVYFFRDSATPLRSVQNDTDVFRSLQNDAVALAVFVSFRMKQVIFLFVQNYSLIV